MKIYDCFQFFDENMMLDLRLNILNKFIHKFIIVENLYMHSGKKKDPVFNINNFIKFKDKIEYILIDKLPDGMHDISKLTDEDDIGNRTIDNTLMIEHAQRNSIYKGLSDSNENDLIIVSDVDEIPNLEKIEFNKINEKLIHFKQKMYYYKFNLRYSSKPWFGSKACLKKNFISAQWLRDTKEKKYPLWRFDIFFSKMKYNSIFHVEDGGWHFVNIKSPKEIEKKLKNFGHHWEFSDSKLGLNDIESMIEQDRAIYDYHADSKKSKWSGNEKLKKTNLSELPEFIIKNKDKYSLWLK